MRKQFGLLCYTVYAVNVLIIFKTCHKGDSQSVIRAVLMVRTMEHNRKENPALNDKELGKRFTAGGEQELEEIIGIFGEKLLRYATTIMCNYHDAEDAVQTVFLLAYKNRRNFDGEHLSAWLYRITYNHCISQLKKRKLIFFSDLASVREDTVDPYEQNAMSDDILEMLSRLKADDRALLYARIIDEHSYEELSSIFDRSPAALRKQYERAKKKLAGYLSSEANYSERSNKNEYRCEQVR